MTVPPETIHTHREKETRIAPQSIALNWRTRSKQRMDVFDEDTARSRVDWFCRPIRMRQVCPPNPASRTKDSRDEHGPVFGCASSYRSFAQSTLERFKFVLRWFSLFLVSMRWFSPCPGAGSARSCSRSTRAPPALPREWSSLGRWTATRIRRWPKSLASAHSQPSKSSQR